MRHVAVAAVLASAVACKTSTPSTAINSAAVDQTIPGEVPAETSLPCFPGAYYRKAVSSFGDWTGITGVAVLGYPSTDPNRLDSQRNNLPLDNFSIYMGGNAGGDFEVDAGMTWTFSVDKATGKTSQQRIAWRPFWRTNVWNNPPNVEQYTWYPGDTIQMSVVMVAPQKLRMTIADAGKHPKKKFEVDFDAEGFTQDTKRQFKRVNAIDQVRNEGKPVQPTTAKVVNSEWLYTNLHHQNVQVPMTKARFTDMRCADAKHIKVTTTNAATGAERIDIVGQL
ncbi:MAG: hypothetical protein ACO1OQ_10930 [Rufibacter sp.]